MRPDLDIPNGGAGVVSDTYHIKVAGQCVAHTEEFIDVVNFVRAEGGADTFDVEPGKGWSATGRDGKSITVTKEIEGGADRWLG